MSYMKFNASSSGNNTIVAGEANKTIRVQAIFMQAGALTTAILRSGTTSGGDMTGPMVFATGGGLNLPIMGTDLFVCEVGESLVMNVSSLTPAVAGALMYTQE